MAAVDWATGHTGQPRLVALLLLVLAPAAVALLFTLNATAAIQRFPGGLPGGSPASRLVAASVALGGLAAIYAAALGILWMRATLVAQRQKREVSHLDRTLRRQANELRQAREHAELLTAMREVSRIVASGSDFDAVLGDVLRIVDDFAWPQDATIFLDDGDGRLVPRASLGRNELDTIRALGGANQAARRHQVIRRVDSQAHTLTLYIPFETDQDLPGVLHIVREFDVEPPEPTADASGLGDAVAQPRLCERELAAFERRIVYFIKHVALAVRHLTLYDRATIDGLTRLYNRQTCDRALAGATARADCADAGDPLSVIVIDIDHFKKVNDVHGHLSGDIVLASVARVLRQAVGETDLAFRYGGEEMIVLCPGRDADNAALLAETIRRAVATTDMRGEHGQAVPVTVSSGVAAYSAGEGRERWFSRADSALYRSKEGGRNQVTIASPPAASAA